MQTQRFLWGESRMLMEYLQAAYPGRTWHTNMAVGPIRHRLPREELTDAERRLLGGMRRYADAVVELDGRLVVVETTIIRAVHKIGPLLEYVKLVPETEELGDRRLWPVTGELVSALRDDRAAALARQVGQRFVHFPLAWIDTYMEIYGRRFRRAPLSQFPTRFVD